MTELLCLHGFIPSGAPAPPPDLPGMEGSPIEELGLEGFRAVYSRVEGAAYAADRLEERMRDLGWLAARGLDHERVVSWFVDHGQILPVPLLTLYRTAEALRQAAVEHGAAVLAQLARFAGRAEWDLKVAYDAERLGSRLGEVSAEIAGLDAEIESAPPGRRYLLEKKRTAVAKERIAETASRLADEVLADLRRIADDVRTISLPATRDLPVVLYAAALIEGTRAVEAGDVVAAHAARLEELGLRLDYTGPWAPYRFIDGPP